MFGYAVHSENITVSVRGGKQSSPLLLSANSYAGNLKPFGLVSIEGEVYNSAPEGLPSLVVYKNGGISLRDECSLFDVVNARFIVSGASKLLSNYEACNPNHTLNIQEKTKATRMGVGILDDGRLLFLAIDGTFSELQTVFKAYPVRDAMMLACGNVYIKDQHSEVEKGTLPLVVFDINSFDAIASPVVIVDAGHGGLDTGVKAFGLMEKHIALDMAKYVYEYLNDNYVGTFILTRTKDVTITTEERVQLVNAMDAGFLLSLHINGATNADIRGFTTYTHTEYSDFTGDLRNTVHNTTLNAMSSYGVIDNGKSVADMQLLREVECPSVLFETLFLTNPQDAKMLGSPQWLRRLSEVIADSVAKSLHLSSKMTVEATPEPYVTYSVIAGDYTYLTGAEEMASKLRQAGFDCSIRIKTKKE